ncbi:MAG: tetratricopeptide repeat protein [Bacteroidales bacterium]
MVKRLFYFLFFIPVASTTFGEQRNYDIEYSYIESIRNRESGNLTAAAYILTSILRVDSTCAACLYDLSQIYRDAGSNEVAVNYAARAYRLDTTNYWYIKNYADLLLLSGDSLAAVGLLSKIINISSATYDDRINFLRIAINYPVFKEKVANLVVLMREDYADPELYHLYFLLRKNMYHESFSTLNRFLDTCFNMFGLHLRFVLDRSVLFAENGKFRKARKYFMQYFRNDSFSFEAVYQYSRFFSKTARDRKFVYDYIDRFFTTKDDLPKRIEWLNMMLHSKSEIFLKYLDDRLISFLNRDTFPPSVFDDAFSFYLQLNQMEKLEILGKRYVSLYPDNISAWSRYILPLYAMGKFAILDSLLDARPAVFATPFGFYVAGVLTYNRKEYNRSRNFLILSLNVQGNFGYKANAVNILADLYYNKGMRDSAFFYYEKAITEDFADETIMNNYAYYLAQSGKNLNKAEILARAAVLRYPRNAAFLDTYAWVLYRLKSYNEALHYMRRALRYVEGGDRRELLEHYAAILYCAGYRAKSIKLLNKLFPNSKEYDAFFINTIECNER